jgi:hypothetical protein
MHHKIQAPCEMSWVRCVSGERRDVGLMVKVRTAGLRCAARQRRRDRFAERTAQAILRRQH